jgi:hypothetical protein
MAAVGRSMALLRRTWGEALVGNMGLNFILFLLAIPCLMLLILGGVLLFQGMQVAGIVLLAAAGISFLIHMAISSALNTIFLSALYLYASEERVPEGFDRNVMTTAFGRA